MQKIPENFTGADFSALTSESFMVAAKEKIARFEQEVCEWVSEQKDLGNKEVASLDPTKILPETYLSLRYPDDPEKWEEVASVVIEQEHLEKALVQVVPSISLQELRKYEALRDKYS